MPHLRNGTGGAQLHRRLSRAGATCFGNQRVEGGVVLTLVDPDVEGWHAKLKARGVNVPDKVEYSETYRVTHFFFRDPAGYLLEIQRFERPDWPEPLPAL